MNVPILFQSLDRISGKEGRSKLLHNQSDLYRTLQKVKEAITEQYAVGEDRMDLHIEITKNRRDPAFRTKAESLNDQSVDLANVENWGYLGRAFVLFTPKVEEYGKTHITVAFFGRHPRPKIDVLRDLVKHTIK